MAKYADTSVQDGLLAVIQTATEYYFNATQPTDRATAISTSVIAAGTPAYTGPSTGGGGRQLQVDALADQTATSGGDVDHVSLCTGTTLIIVTTLAATKTVNTNDDVSVAAWTVTSQDIA